MRQNLWGVGSTMKKSKNFPRNEAKSGGSGSHFYREYRQICYPYVIPAGKNCTLNK